MSEVSEVVMTHDNSANGTIELKETIKQKLKEFLKGYDKMTYCQFINIIKCHSRLYAERIFDCIDINKSGYISIDDLTNALYILQSKDTHKRIEFIFKMFDSDDNGKISKQELSKMLMASIDESSMNYDVISNNNKERLQNSLLKLFEFKDDVENDEITFESFKNTLETYPDIIEGFTLENFTFFENQNKYIKKKDSIYKKILKYVINRPQRVITYTLVPIIILLCFFWRFYKYAGDCDEYEISNSDYSIRCRYARKRYVMGWSLNVAKGCGQAMKFIFTIILFPVSRNFMTWLRSTFLRHIFDFDNAIAFHKLLGTIGFFLAWIHTLCHICDVVRWTDPKREEKYLIAFPDETKQPSFKDLVQKEPVIITGFILIIVYTLAVIFAFDIIKKFFNSLILKLKDTKNIKLHQKMALWLGKKIVNFDYFYVTHHLFIIFYIILIIHPMPHVPNEKKEWGYSDTYIWISIPVLIYIIERMVRVFKGITQDTTLISAKILPGNTIELKIRKPLGFHYVSGQYIFIKCPQISKYQWHPFTMTSSPDDPFISVHVRALGDWTKALKDIVKSQTDGMTNDPEAVPITSNIIHKNTSDDYIDEDNLNEKEIKFVDYKFDILVDGPFGAPAQNHNDFEVIILIGAGIGVTPFASVVSDLLHKMQRNKCHNCGHGHMPQNQKIKKVYFHWTVRLRDEAIWFKNVLESIKLEDINNFIDINIHVTSIRNACDIRMILFRLVQYYETSVRGVCPVSELQMKSVTNFGRPDWNEIFENVKNTHLGSIDKCGVFFCGPHTLAKILKKQCVLHSNSRFKFIYKKEIF